MENEEENPVWSNIEWFRQNNIVELNETNALYYFMTSPFYDKKNARNEKAKKTKPNAKYEYKVNSIKNGVIIIEKLHIEGGGNDKVEIFYMLLIEGVYCVYKANILLDVLKSRLNYINANMKKLLE